MGYVDLIQSEVLDPFGDSPYASHVDSIHEACQDVLQQVERILAYAQDGDVDDIQEDWTDLTATVAESLAAMSELAHRRGVAVNFDPPGRITINGDETRLRRLVRNLVSNAIKFSTTGASIRVELEDEQDGVHLSVIDKGKGMSEEEVLAVTTPFAGGGTALGMATVKRVVDLHDAHLEIESIPERGTTVRVSFPSSRASPVGRLRTALAKEQFELYFQPKVRLRDGVLVGFEALLRWNDPSRGVIPPIAFLDIAEEASMMREISNWVLKAACRQMADWGDAAVPVSINLSADDFDDPSLSERVRLSLQEYSIPPEMLEVEITENHFMKDHVNVSSNLDALAQIGVAVSIDDFGTGYYSSLAYLKDLHVSRIKLDKSFVQNSVPGDKGFAVACATIGLAHALELSVVAEGIETPEQLRALIEEGCSEGQGFLFAKPLPADQVDLKASYELAHYDVFHVIATD